MRYRALDANGDYQFGSLATFLTNSPQAVAQAVETRLLLLIGEWFLDSKEGLDTDAILGVNTQSTRDRAVQERILGTEGVNSIISYGSSVDGRAFSVTATIDTIYGAATISGNF